MTVTAALRRRLRRAAERSLNLTVTPARPRGSRWIVRLALRA